MMVTTAMSLSIPLSETKAQLALQLSQGKLLKTSQHLLNGMPPSESSTHNKSMRF
jgi:hypothetical protein